MPNPLTCPGHNVFLLICLHKCLVTKELCDTHFHLFTLFLEFCFLITIIDHDNINKSGNAVNNDIIDNGYKEISL